MTLAVEGAVELEVLGLTNLGVGDACEVEVVHHAILRTDV